MRSRRPTSPVGSSSRHRQRGAIATTIRGPASGPTESEGGDVGFPGLGAWEDTARGVQDRCMAPRRRDGCPMPVVEAPRDDGFFFCVRRIEWGRTRPTAAVAPLRVGPGRHDGPPRAARAAAPIEGGGGHARRPELDLVASDIIRRGSPRGAVRRDDVLVHPLSSYDVGPCQGADGKAGRGLHPEMAGLLRCVDRVRVTFKRHYGVDGLTFEGVAGLDVRKIRTDGFHEPGQGSGVVRRVRRVHPARPRQVAGGVLRGRDPRVGWLWTCGCGGGSSGGCR